MLDLCRPSDSLAWDSHLGVDQTNFTTNKVRRTLRSLTSNRNGIFKNRRQPGPKGLLASHEKVAANSLRGNFIPTPLSEAKLLDQWNSLKCLSLVHLWVTEAGVLTASTGLPWLFSLRAKQNQNETHFLQWTELRFLKCCQQPSCLICHLENYNWQIKDTLFGAAKWKQILIANWIVWVTTNGKGPFSNLDCNQDSDKVWLCFWGRGYQCMPDLRIPVWGGGLITQGTTLFLALGRWTTSNYWLSSRVTGGSSNCWHFLGYQSACYVHTSMALKTNLCHDFSFLVYQYSDANKSFIRKNCLQCTDQGWVHFHNLLLVHTH